MSSCIQASCKPPKVLWLSLSSHLHQFDLPLLQCLSQSVEVSTWQYCQHVDEPGSLAEAAVLLDDYLGSLTQPVHAIGHGMSGVLGLVYARLFHERIKSLSLLSVGVQPARDWQAQYYDLRRSLSCSQTAIVAQMVRQLFGPQPAESSNWLQALFQRELEESFSPHSLWKTDTIPAGGCDIPLFIAGSCDDTVVSIEALRGWQKWLKEGDRLWECYSGRHFFHRFYPKSIERELLQFWQTTERHTCPRVSAIAGSCSIP